MPLAKLCEGSDGEDWEESERKADKRLRASPCAAAGAEAEALAPLAPYISLHLPISPISPHISLHLQALAPLAPPSQLEEARGAEEARRQLKLISPHLPVSPHISLYLPASRRRGGSSSSSPHISLYLSTSPCISPHLPVSPCISQARRQLKLELKCELVTAQRVVAGTLLLSATKLAFVPDPKKAEAEAAEELARWERRRRGERPPDRPPKEKEWSL